MQQSHGLFAIAKLLVTLGALMLTVDFTCRCTTSNVVDCLQSPKTVNDVRNRAPARKTGAGI